MIVVPTYNMILSPEASLYLPLDMLRRSAESTRGKSSSSSWRRRTCP